MSPPNPRDADSKYMLHRYLQCLSDQEQETSNSPNLEESAIATGNDEEGETEGVTYFVDEDGRYYYQQNGEAIVSLASGPIEETVTTQAPIEHHGPNGFQTVTLMPAENANGDVSYVLVVQEDTKPVIKTDQGAEEPAVVAKPEAEDVDEFEEDVYNFEEEPEPDDDDDEDFVANETVAPKKSRKRKARSSQYPCNFCTYTTPKRYLLIRHLNTHSEERPHTCHVCERGFKTLSSLTNHVNMHNGVKPHICKYCNSPFTTSGELVRHIRYKHTHEKPHKCSECDYASVELSKLRRHVRCHTGERPYQCPHCTYASPDSFKLKRHIRTHTGEKPYKCDSCTMAFTQSNSLKTHKLIHDDSKKPVYACELCPTKCGRKTDLRIHVQNLHTSDTPLKCKRCGKTFPDRYSCKMHNKTHEGEKCFKCEICLYASTTLRHLKTHMLKHTDEKPFVCDHCDQSFRQRQLLKRHENLYHNPDYVPKPAKEKTHACRECNRMFAHKGNLIRHLAIHDPESDHREMALALKLGREKKVKYVEGPVEQEVEEIDEEDEDTDEDEEVDEDEEKQMYKLKAQLQGGELVTVAAADGQQYLVLEVILDGTTEEQDAVNNLNLANNMGNESPIETAVATKQQNKGVKLEKEVDTCFGFDEQDEEIETQYVTQT